MMDLAWPVLRVGSKIGRLAETGVNCVYCGMSCSSSWTRDTRHMSVHGV